MKNLRLTLILLIATCGLWATGLNLRKTEQSAPPLRHPYTHLLNKNVKQIPASNSKSPNFNKVLVILVDFQE